MGNGRAGSTISVVSRKSKNRDLDRSMYTAASTIGSWHERDALCTALLLHVKGRWHVKEAIARGLIGKGMPRLVASTITSGRVDNWYSPLG
jgi:hypothetical protein